MYLPKYYEDPQTLHVGTEPYRAWYVPCESLKEARKLDMESSTQVQMLNGADWKFSWYENARLIPEECIRKNYETGGLKDIRVPGCWQFFGYDSNQYSDCRYPIPFDPPYVPDQNPAGVYIRDFTYTKSLGQRVYLNFDGVDSCHYVWLNGMFVGYSQVSHNISEFDVTDQIVDGANRLTVIVLKWCDGTYLEDQDKLRWSGIFRDVYLITRPQAHIRDFFVHARVSEALDRADIRIDWELSGSAPVKVCLLDGEICLEEASQDGTEHGESAGSVSFTLENPVLWNAEQPCLYGIQLECGGEVIYQQLALRRTEIRGNVMLLNGQKFKLKGVNRHDSDPFTGYTISREQFLKDLRLMKENNINAIRTSHYPNAPWTLPLCEQLGFYLIDEADVESNGCLDLYGGGGYQDRMKETHEDFTFGLLMQDPAFEKSVVDRVQGMVCRDKNHGCVLIWSLGNESGYGENMVKAAAWVKSYDPDRELLYENSIWEKDGKPNDVHNLDIYSRMYAPVEFIDWYCTQEGKKPLIEVEYSHAMGNGPGDLEAYYQRLYQYDGYTGGFVWEWCDHSVWDGRTTEGKDRFLYGGDFGEEFDDGNFCMDGLVYPDRRPHTGLLELKNVSRPVRIVEYEAASGTVVLKNMLDFAVTGDYYDICWTLERDGSRILQGCIPEPDIRPHETIKVSIPELAEALQEKGVLCLRLEYIQNRELPMTEKGHSAGFDQVLINGKAGDGKSLEKAGEENYCQFRTEAGPEEFVIAGKGFRYVFDRFLGTFSSLERDGIRVLEKPVSYNIWRAPMDNDRNIRLEWEKAGYDRVQTKVLDTGIEQNEDEVIIRSEFRLGASWVQWIFRGVTTWTVNCDGTIFVETEGKRNMELPFLPRFGLRIFLPETFCQAEYFGYGPYESYPDKHQSSWLSRFSSSVEALHEDYLRPQENGSHWNCSFVELREENGRRIRAEGSGFSFNASGYTQEELAGKLHSFELEKSPYTVLCLDGYMSGSGSNSCGPELSGEYRVAQETLKMKFAIKFT